MTGVWPRRVEVPGPFPGDRGLPRPTSHPIGSRHASVLPAGTPEDCLTEQTFLPASGYGNPGFGPPLVEARLR